MGEQQQQQPAASSPRQWYLASAREDEYETIAGIYTSATVQQPLNMLIFRPIATQQDKTAMQLVRIRQSMKEPGSGIVTARTRALPASRPTESSPSSSSSSSTAIADSGGEEIVGYVLWRTVLLSDKIEIEGLSSTSDDHDDSVSMPAAVDSSDGVLPVKQEEVVVGEGAKKEREKEKKPGFDAAALINTDMAGDFLVQVATLHHADLQGIKHIHLNHLYVKPRMAGQGIGKALVRACLEEADRLALPAYVSASPAGTPLYRQLGFVETGHFDTDMARFAPKYSGYGVYRETHLLRPAVSSSSSSPSSAHHTG